MSGLPQRSSEGPPRGHGPADDPDTSIADLLNILWRRRWAIVLTVVLLTGAAQLVALEMVPQYTATASIMIEAQEQQVVDLEQVQPRLAADQSTLESQAELIRSRNLAARTMDDLGLFDDPEFVGPFEFGGPLGPVVRWVRRASDQAWTFADAWLPENLFDGALPMAAAGPIEPDLAMKTSAINRFIEKLEVKQAGESHVLLVSYTSPDPAKAAAIANQIAEIYVDRRLEENRRVTARANEWLSERLQTLRRQVLDADDAVAAFPAGSSGPSLTGERVGDLNRALVEARARRTDLEARLGLIRDLRQSGRDLDSIAEAVASPLIAGLRQQEAQLLREQAELASTFGPSHPRMQAAQEEKQKLAVRIRDEIARIIHSLENELDVVLMRERSVASELEEAKDESVLADRAEVRRRELEREAEAKRKLYETVLARFQETKMQAGLLEADASVLEARVPDAPSSLSPLVVIAVGFTTSTIFGSMLALLLEQLDKSIRSSRQIERMLGVRCLGVIPQVRRKGKPMHRYLSSNPRSAYAEAIRGLYATTLVTDAGPAPEIILVTSALPDEGKTSIASSLAVLAAQLGRKTLLIDADLRRPRVAQEFDITPSQGVVGVIAHNQDFDAALVQDEASGVDLLAVEDSPSNPTLLLSSSRLRSMLNEARHRYECIIVDSPPLLGVTDAQILSLHVDATVFVVRWQQTKKEAAEAALEALRAAAAKVAGAVLMQVDLNRHARFRYGDATQYYDRYRDYYR